MKYTEREVIGKNVDPNNLSYEFVDVE